MPRNDRDVPNAEAANDHVGAVSDHTELSPSGSNDHLNDANDDMRWLAQLDYTPSNPPDNSVSHCSIRDTSLRVLYHSVDFLRITAVTQTLCARWLHQLFLELERYNHAPSMEVQKTWLGYPIIGIAGSLSILVKIANALSKSEQYLAAQDYLFAIFCSSIFYFFLDLCQGAESLPLGAFIASSAVALPLVAAFFVNLALPDSDNHCHLSESRQNALNAASDVDNIYLARFLNSMCGMNYGFSSMTTMLWMINREVHGKTVALPRWQMSFVGVAALSALKLGYDLIEHPRRFEKLVMCAKFLKDGALTYAAFSGIFFMLFHRQAYYEHTAFRAFLIVACTVLALGIGFYSAATTRFRFEENNDAINKTIAHVRDASASIKKIGMIGFFADRCKNHHEQFNLPTPAV